MNREFKFPFTVKLDTNKVRVKNSLITSGVNLLDYVPKEEIDKATNIVVMGDNCKVTWFKGKGLIGPKDTWYMVNTPNTYTGNHKNIFITKTQDFTWWFNDLTSSYRNMKGQHYVEVSLEEVSSEIDVLVLANELSFLYGVQFKVHTVSQTKGIYHLTVDDDIDISVFSDIQVHQDEIHNVHCLWVECKVHGSTGKEENKMPVGPTSWEW